MRFDRIARVVASALFAVGCAGAPAPSTETTPAAPVAEAAPVEAAPPAPEPPKGPEKIDLVLAVRPGDVFRYVQNQHIDQAMKIGETDASMALDAASSMTYTIATVREDGQTDVRVEMGDIKGTFRSSMFGTIDFDTASSAAAKPDNPVSAAAVKGITNLAHARFEMTLDRHGNLVAVQGLREFLEKALKDDKALAGKHLETLVDDEGMKQQMQGRFVRFAEGPVEVGATWTIDSAIKSPMAMTMSTRYLLKSADAETVVVDATSTALAADAGAPAVTVESTVVISRRDGLMLKSESKTRTVKDMELKKPAAAGADAPAPKMHLDMTVTATIERVTADTPTPPAPTAAPK
jgi:hypothetical protein